MSTTKNVRFWIHGKNGRVKITMRPGQVLSWGQSWRTEEGYSYESFRLEYFGDDIYQERASGGSDCDGPIDDYATLVCPVSMLHSRPLSDKYCAITLFPQWERLKSRVHDAYAEMAGY